MSWIVQSVGFTCWGRSTWKGKIFNHVVGVILLCGLVTACGQSVDSANAPAPCDLSVVKSELNGLNSDLQIWRALKEQDLRNSIVEESVATAVLKHILTVGIADFRVEDLTGLPLETLCRTTTDEVRAIIETHPNEVMTNMALAYIRDITPTVLAEVQRVQTNMLGSGCDLSPRN